jgi:hypothetical protein
MKKLYEGKQVSPVHVKPRLTLYPLFIILVVLTSGCTFIGAGGTGTIPVDAIVVNSFSADPPIAEPDDVVSFFLDIENVGGTTARCVTSELFGIETWNNDAGLPLTYARPWRSNGIGFSYSSGRLNFNYWDPGQGYLSFGYDRGVGISLSSYVSDSWNQFSAGFCNAAGQWTQFSEVKYFESMNPAVPAQNKPGQSFTTQWILRPPKLPEGVHTTYPVTARTSYHYTSNAHINLLAYNKAEAERRELLGEPVDFPLIVDESYASPIQIAVVRGKNPIVVNQRAPGLELVNYLFEFRNVGNGWPLPMSSDVTGQNGFIFATVELNGPGAQFYDCLGASDGSEIFVYGDQLSNIVKLRADKTAPFGCTIQVDRAQWTDTPAGTISLTFKLWYRYYTDAHTTVDVLGVQKNF